MRLVVNVGNTHIQAGVFQDGKLVDRFRIHTVSRKTEDEYSTIFRSIMEERGMEQDGFSSVLLASVVPPLTDALLAMLRRITGRSPIVLCPESYGKLPLGILNPVEIGTDLVADALAARSLFPGKPTIVADFGTALSFTATDASGVIQGVSIVPGLSSAIQALSRDTAQLPFVQLQRPSTALGKNTIHAIQSGIIYGYAGLVSSLGQRLSRELGGGAKLVATGGSAGLMAPVAECFDAVEENLTLLGLDLAASAIVGASSP